MSWKFYPVSFWRGVASTHRARTDRWLRSSLTLEKALGLPALDDTGWMFTCFDPYASVLFAGQVATRTTTRPVVLPPGDSTRCPDR